MECPLFSWFKIFAGNTRPNMLWYYPLITLGSTDREILAVMHYSREFFIKHFDKLRQNVLHPTKFVSKTTRGSVGKACVTHLSFCFDHLASVICCLSSVNFSHFNLLLKPIGQMNWNLVESIYGMSSLKSAHFVMIYYQTWPSTGNACFWLANLKKSPPLKTLGQINRNMAGSIYGMSSMKMLISSRSVTKHGHHRQFYKRLFLMEKGAVMVMIVW
jgi:hypothetical protein